MLGSNYNIFRPRFIMTSFTNLLNKRRHFFIFKPVKCDDFIT